MKKIIILLTVFGLFTLNINSQIPKQLHGFYAKIFLVVGDTIKTEDNCLIVKTAPTAWYFAEIDSITHINIVQIGTNQVAKFSYSFKLYMDYFQYWNFYNPVRLSWTQTHFTTDWIDIMDGSGFSFETGIPAQIKAGIAAKFNIQLSQVQILSY